MSSSGSLLLTSFANKSGPVSASNLFEAILDSMSSLTVSDSAGHSRTLYVASSDAPDSLTRLFSLPPVPPADIFDIRFSDDTRLFTAGVETRSKSVIVKGGIMPLTLRWNWKHGERIGLSGGGIDTTIAGSGSIVFGEHPGSLVVTSSGTSTDAIPTAYTLSQNYPNPFNSTTLIKYELPERSHVRIQVTNILGQVVSVITDAIEDAGYRSAVWSADALASGIYFYSISAVGVDREESMFREVRKALILK
jgi:hypothetical protein